MIVVNEQWLIDFSGFCESDADWGTSVVRKHTVTRTPPTSGVRYLLQSTWISKPEGVKSSIMPPTPLFFFPPSFSLSPKRTFDATGGGVLFCVYCNSGGRGFSFSFLFFKADLVPVETNGGGGGLECCMLPRCTQSFKSQQGALMLSKVSWDNQGKLDSGLPGKQEYSVSYNLQHAILRAG